MNATVSKSEAYLGSQMMTAVALSYVIDAALLTGFAYVGTVGPSIPLYYLLAGMADTAIFMAFRRWAIRDKSRTEQFTLPQIVAASAIQLTFAALVPPLAFYFFSVLYVVFGCGSLALNQAPIAHRVDPGDRGRGNTDGGVGSANHHSAKHFGGAWPRLALLCGHAGPLRCARCLRSQACGCACNVGAASFAIRCRCCRSATVHWRPPTLN